jgi:hypothetical protein
MKKWYIWIGIINYYILEPLFNHQIIIHVNEDWSFKRLRWGKPDKIDSTWKTVKVNGGTLSGKDFSK